MRLLFTFTDEHFQHSTMVKKNKTSMKKDNGNLQTINSLKLYRIIMKSTHIFRSMAYFGNEKLLDALIPNQIYLAVANIYRVTFIRLKLLRITAILPRYSISKKKSINKRLLVVAHAFTIKIWKIFISYEKLIKEIRLSRKFNIPYIWDSLRRWNYKNNYSHKTLWVWHNNRNKVKGKSPKT